jgi:hypothetical protein
VTLAEARVKAAGYRSMLAKGIDPLDAKKAGLLAVAARKTFGQCADELIKSKRREWRSDVHAGQWRTTIDSYCGPIMDAGTVRICGSSEPRSLEKVAQHTGLTRTLFHMNEAPTIDVEQIARLDAGTPGTSWIALPVSTSPASMVSMPSRSRPSPKAGSLAIRAFASTP